MRSSTRVRRAVHPARPTVRATPTTTLALLISARLLTQTRCLAGLRAVSAMFPAHVRAVMLADRGFARARCVPCLHAPQCDSVVRLAPGSGLTARDGRRWTGGAAGLPCGHVRWVPAVRDGRSHGRARAVDIHVAVCWQTPARRARHPRSVSPRAVGCSHEHRHRDTRRRLRGATRLD